MALLGYTLIHIVCVTAIDSLLCKNELCDSDHIDDNLPHYPVAPQRY